MKGVKIKKIYGYKSVVVTDMNIDLLAAYKIAHKGSMSFYVQVDGGLQSWGIFTVSDRMGIADVSIAIKAINE